GERRRPLSPSLQQQGQNQEEQHCDGGNHQNEQQNQHSEIHFPIDPVVQAQILEDPIWLQGEEEKRRVVSHRRDVVAVTTRKAVRVVAGQQVGKGIGLGSGGRVEQVQGWIVGQVRGDCRFLLRSEAGLLGQDQD